MDHSRNIAVIGGGPSGLMAAEVLASAGHRVTVYDRMPSPGRKLLMAGRGGLNLTHSESLELFLTRFGAASDWLAPSLRSFTPDTLRAWCEGLGEETFIGSSGRVFPRKLKAAPLLRAWLQRLEKLNVRFAGRHHWRGWEGSALIFKNHEGEKVLVNSDATLLALGGASWPRLGSDGVWSAILKAEGVTLAPFEPANGGFIVPWSEYFSARFAGQPLKPLALTHNGVTRRGEAMVTKQGLEGGAVYALSASLREAIARDGKAILTLDLRPDMTLEALMRKLDAPRGAKSFSSYLRKAGFAPVAIALLREGVSPGQLTGASPAQLAAFMKNLSLTVTGTTGLARAISTAGGITQNALDEHFMLRAKPGTFAAGEMLDWEAPTGGYLLQACFSTAVAAAKGILHFTKA